MNRLVTGEEIELVIKIPINKSPWPDSCTPEFYQTLKKNYHQIFTVREVRD